MIVRDCEGRGIADMMPSGAHQPLCWLCLLLISLVFLSSVCATTARLTHAQLNASNTTLEQRMIANGVFGTLNEAYNAFVTSGK